MHNKSYFERYLNLDSTVNISYVDRMTVCEVPSLDHTVNSSHVDSMTVCETPSLDHIVKGSYVNSMTVVFYILC